MGQRLKVFEAFSGVGSQRMALRNISLPHEVVAVSEIDKYAIRSYTAIHGETLNLGDISQVAIDDIPDHDLFTYSFPCQDISICGRLDGLSEGSGTRSSLLWECKRVIEGKHPKFLLLENVKNLVGTKNIADFERWLTWLEEQGYRNYRQMLNAKDYGIPQNRERVFVVSILQDGQTQLFDDYGFPSGTPSDMTISDVLEEVVEDKHFVSQEVMSLYEPKSNENVERRNQIVISGYIEGCSSYKYEQHRRVYHPNGISPTVHTSGGGGQHLKVIVNGRIRRLTPREYWRLMGFTDSDFDKVRPIMSDSQLYKQAGNSIAVPVLEAIFTNLFKG